MWVWVWVLGTQSLVTAVPQLAVLSPGVCGCVDAWVAGWVYRGPQCPLCFIHREMELIKRLLHPVLDRLSLEQLSNKMSYGLTHTPMTQT